MVSYGCPSRGTPSAETGPSMSYSLKKPRAICDPLARKRVTAASSKRCDDRNRNFVKARSLGDPFTPMATRLSAGDDGAGMTTRGYVQANRLRQAGLIIRGGDFEPLFYRVHGITHDDAGARPFEHFAVVEIVPDGHHLRALDAVELCEAGQRRALGRVASTDINQ